MNWAKKYLLLFAILFSTVQLQAQKDSIHSVFKPIKFNIHYSNLQWEVGYGGYVFNHAYLSGLSLDLFGIVFNDVNFAFGIDNAGNAGGGYNRGVQVVSYNVQSYSDVYFKVEPMLFPDKLFNLSMPVKFAESTLSYPDTSTAIPTNGYGRRGRRPSTSFLSITPGVFGYVNLFPRVNIGAGVAYRFALSEGSAGTFSDYNNFSFSLLVRVRLAFRHKQKAPSAKKDDYYDSTGRFQ